MALNNANCYYYLASSQDQHRYSSKNQKDDIVLFKLHARTLLTNVFSKLCRLTNSAICSFCGIPDTADNFPLSCSKLDVHVQHLTICRRLTFFPLFFSSLLDFRTRRAEDEIDHLVSLRLSQFHLVIRFLLHYK